MIDGEYKKILKQYHNKSPDLNRFTLVTPKSENDVRLQATLANQNPTGLPVGTVRVESTLEVHKTDSSLNSFTLNYFFNIFSHNRISPLSYIKNI